MNKVLFGFFVVVLMSFIFVACDDDKNDDKLSTDLIQNPITADGQENLNELPIIKFKTQEHDFGKIIDGVKVAFKFRFTNVGGADLIISQVKTTCGCTVSRFSKEAIIPGESGFIELTFDSQRRTGFNHKSATVLTNAQPNVTSLSIKAMVMSADDL